MKIFGHPWIENEKFYVVTSKEQILKTAPNGMLTIGSLLDESMRALALYCQENGLRYALEVKTIHETIFANLMGCTYAICDQMLAKELIPLAEKYLFDMQILVYSEESSNMETIETLAKIGVDGIIYTEAFVAPVSA